MILKQFAKINSREIYLNLQIAKISSREMQSSSSCLTGYNNSKACIYDPYDFSILTHCLKEDDANLCFAKDIGRRNSVSVCSSNAYPLPLDSKVLNTLHLFMNRFR